MAQEQGSQDKSPKVAPANQGGKLGEDICGVTMDPGEAIPAEFFDRLEGILIMNGHTDTAMMVRSLRNS